MMATKKKAAAKEEAPVDRPKFKCVQCKYRWQSRVDKPKKCPGCFTRDWKE